VRTGAARAYSENGACRGPPTVGAIGSARLLEVDTNQASGSFRFCHFVIFARRLFEHGAMLRARNFGRNSTQLLGPLAKHAHPLKMVRHNRAPYGATKAKAWVLCPSARLHNRLVIRSWLICTHGYQGRAAIPAQIAPQSQNVTSVLAFGPTDKGPLFALGFSHEKRGAISMTAQRTPLARQYRRYAEEVRTIAGDDDYHVTRSALLIVANSFDLMAASLEYGGFAAKEPARQAWPQTALIPAKS
jgi:hypothetical protein